jgi:hypothetical protein
LVKRLAVFVRYHAGRDGDAGDNASGDRGSHIIRAGCV